MARQRFTERWIRSRRAAADVRHEYVDAATPGLWLRVSGRDARVFSVLARVGGRLRRRTLGRHPRWSLADARAEAGRLLRMVDEGLDPFAPVPCAAPSQPQQPAPAPAVVLVPAPAGPTFEEVLEDYSRLHLAPNARSASAIARNLRHPALAAFQGRPLASITRADIVAALDGMVAAGMPQAALNTHRRLGMFMGWAADRDVIPANPCARVRPPAKAVERDRVLFNSEIRAIWLAADRLSGSSCSIIVKYGMARTSPRKPNPHMASKRTSSSSSSSLAASALRIFSESASHRAPKPNVAQSLTASSRSAVNSINAASALSSVIAPSAQATA